LRRALGILAKKRGRHIPLSSKNLFEPRFIGVSLFLRLAESEAFWR